MLDLGYLQQSVEELRPVIRQLYGIPPRTSSLELSHRGPYHAQLINNRILLRVILPYTPDRHLYRVRRGIPGDSQQEEDEKINCNIDSWYDGKIEQGSGWNIQIKVLRSAESLPTSRGETGERLEIIPFDGFSEVKSMLKERVPWASTFGEVIHMSVNHTYSVCIPLSFVVYHLAFAHEFLRSHGKRLVDLGSIISFISERKHVGSDHNDSFRKVFRKLYDYKLRYFRPVPNNHWLSMRTQNGEVANNTGHSLGPLNGICTRRQVASIGGDENVFHLYEARATVSLRIQDRDGPTTVGALNPYKFQIMVLTDESKLKSTRHEDIEEMWDPRELGPAVTQFAVEIWEVFYLAKRAWLEVLEKIDQLVGAELGDLNDAQHLNDLMFDASLERSKTYFTALQILRLVDEWSSESVTSLDELTERVMDVRGSDPGSKGPLPKIRSEVEAEVQKISRRVKAKMAEIESLRDGLFNATSLREATRAMDLNKSIYIFTIVTVLFTPVSFLATMWALPFLNNPEDEGGIVPEPQGFRASFIAVPLLTYGLVGLCAWVMFPQGKWYSFPTQQLLRAWISLCKSLSRFAKNIAQYVVLRKSKFDEAIRSMIE